MIDLQCSSDFVFGTGKCHNPAKHFARFIMFDVIFPIRPVCDFCYKILKNYNDYQFVSEKEYFREQKILILK